MVRRFKARDYETVRGWFEDRRLKAPSPQELSDIGYMVDDRVAGFLYLTNSNVALIDAVISDPYSLPSHRRQSLMKLNGILVDTALSLGYVNIIAITKHPNIEKMAKQLGFVEQSHKVLMLAEKDDDWDVSQFGDLPPDEN